MNGSDFFSGQVTGAGGVAGPRLEGTMFVPAGMGVAWQDTNGVWWKQRLAVDANGATVLDENGFPTLELIQVNI